MYIAIDAGQSHTECAVVDTSGNLFASGRGGPSYVQDGTPLVPDAFDGALASLPQASRTAVRGVLVGATGHQIPGRVEALGALLRARFPCAAQRIVGDAEFALLSYTGDGPGGVLIAGTGSAAMGTWQGRRATAGGHGYLLGDQGGGTGIALQAIRRCLERADSNLALPMFAAELCRHFGVDDIREVPGRLYARAPLDVSLIAGATPIVAGAAATGDTLAVELLQECGRELAGLAGRLALALGLPVGARFPLFLCGGVWSIRTVLAEAFTAALPANIVWQQHLVEASPALAAARYARGLTAA